MKQMSLRHDKRSTLRVSVVFMLACCLFLFAACGTAEPLMLGGTVEAESTDLVTEVAGRIDQLLVEEGQSVTRGAVVALLDGSVQQSSVHQLEQVVAAKEARLKELRDGNRSEQVDQARYAVDAANARYEEALKGPGKEALKTAEAQVAVAQAAVDGAKVLADYTEQARKDAEVLKKDGDLSDTAYKDAVYRRDSADAAFKTAQKQLEASKAQREQVEKGVGDEAITAAKAQVDQAQAQLELLQNGAAGTTIQAAEADLAQSKAALEQGQLILDKYTMKAPCDGVVTLISVNTGEVVNAGTAIGTVSDLGDLSVRLYIPQKNLAAISLGTELDLSATSLPGKKVQGTVTWISVKAEFTPRNTETTASKESTVFRFKVSVLGKETGLKPGMSLEATIPDVFTEQ